MRTFRVALAQVNPTVGDLDGNVHLIIDRLDEARRAKTDLVAFPELCITGYPPEDLLLKPSFITRSREALDTVIKRCDGITAVVGFPEMDDGTIYNAAAVIRDGVLIDVYRKIFLPNYAVFDEDRYFQPGDRCPVYLLGDVSVAVNVCEDIWYDFGPTSVQARAGADVIVNINGSPYHRQKRDERHAMLSARARKNSVGICYVNMVGGQDELVFDGSSVVFDQSGAVLAESPAFEEDLLLVDIDLAEAPSATDATASNTSTYLWAVPDVIDLSASVTGSSGGRDPLSKMEPAARLEPAEEVYRALVLGTRDYVRKSGFEKVVIGLSGGIDSALTAVIAADALGPENVLGVSMPTAYSSEGSVSDSAILSRNLGLAFRTIPISTAVESLRAALAEVFAGTNEGVAEENLQARVRGNILMAIANKFGWMVLSTGNKSEYATGYATLYGDMAGGFAVIKDVPKMLVYEVSKFRNRIAERDLIPETIIVKPPSAELRPDQLDTDSLPPYDVLDPVLEEYVERDRSPADLLEMGFDRAVIERVVQLVDRSEYKRRQAPPGVRITPRAFGKDRRLPIVNRFDPS
ncbi:MAG: NAD+ synthase [Dehalococcoidia bacterium]|jgi:NAD+ synthase (glutamine-hydrolysing)|nr:NAD+ synthase [Dehalococcoidia bacterium]